MIDTEHVKCDTCTAPEPMELDASDEASRGWPTVDIETNPYKAQFPLFQQHPEIAFLDSAATAQRPACVLDAERDFYQRMNANPLRGLYSLSVEATEAIAKVRQQSPTSRRCPGQRGRLHPQHERVAQPGRQEHLHPQSSSRATRSSSPSWSTTPT